jgi:hypothetical protein
LFGEETVCEERRGEERRGEERRGEERRGEETVIYECFRRMAPKKKQPKKKQVQQADPVLTVDNDNVQSFLFVPVAAAFAQFELRELDVVNDQRLDTGGVALGPVIGYLNVVDSGLEEGGECMLKLSRTMNALYTVFDGEPQTILFFPSVFRKILLGHVQDGDVLFRLSVEGGTMKLSVSLPKSVDAQNSEAYYLSAHLLHWVLAQTGGGLRPAWLDLGTGGDAATPSSSSGKNFLRLMSSAGAPDDDDDDPPLPR